MKCPNCQSEIPADARFCGECGQALRQLGKSLVEESTSPGPDLSGLRTIDDMETKSPRGESQRLMQPGEVFAGRYEVSQVIGEGGVGGDLVVERAQHLGDRRLRRHRRQVKVDRLQSCLCQLGLG